MNTTWSTQVNNKKVEDYSKMALSYLKYELVYGCILAISVDVFYDIIRRILCL